MYSDIDMPSIAALAFNRRWKSEGTFRICTIVFDMLEAYFHRSIMSIRYMVSRPDPDDEPDR